MFTRGGGSEVEALRDEVERMNARLAQLDARRDAPAVVVDAAPPAPVAVERRSAEPVEAGPSSDLLGFDAFVANAGAQLERVRRSGDALTLMLVDIDEFREFNATHGTAAGDAALATVTRLLHTIATDADFLGRTGADEFALALTDTPLDRATEQAELLSRLLEDVVLMADASFTVSIGLAEYKRGETIERLLADAASGLDQARSRGGARVAVSVDGGEAERETREEINLDVAEALAAALLERDRYTGEHSRSVVQMSRAIARVLGLNDAETDRIAAAALLHDIGKIALPDRILHKPGKLDEDEWDVVRELPLIGERILRAIPGLGDVARIVRHAHERVDGAGYPDGLKGQEIPIGSRIILACDTYNAMTTKNHYREAMTHADAIRELVKCAGSQFDPRVTEALISDMHQRVQLGRIRPGEVATD